MGQYLSNVYNVRDAEIKRSPVLVPVTTQTHFTSPYPLPAALESPSFSSLSSLLPSFSEALVDLNYLINTNTSFNT